MSEQQQQLSEWAVYVTNVEREKLEAEQVAVVYAMRWQIELMFKLWKSGEGELEQWRSKKPWAILCEVYAKMISLVLGQWMLLTCGWENEKLSMFKGLRVARSHLVGLIKLGVLGMSEAIEGILQGLRQQIKRCTIEPHRQQPSSYQRLAASAGINR